jgi:Cupin domain
MAINTHPRRGYLLHANQGLAPAQPDLKASAGSTGGQLTIFTLSLNGGPPRHTHTREDESIYLFSGRLEVECDGEEFELEVREGARQKACMQGGRHDDRAEGGEQGHRRYRTWPAPVSPTPTLAERSGSRGCELPVYFRLASRTCRDGCASLTDARL